MSITVSLLPPAAPDDAPEIVERKGLGHPDTLCDTLAERFGTALCRFYHQQFGLVLHYNVDKALLWGGASQPAFGGGQVLVPWELFLSGRATRQFRGVTVPVEELAEQVCQAWLAEHFHALDPNRHVKIHCLVRPGSCDLVDLYERQRRSGQWLANDTSCGVGYAPLSPLEQTVLAVESELNAPSIRQSDPHIGPDIKVMGLLSQGAAQLTVACAFVDRYVSDVADYQRKKERLAERIRAIARRTLHVPLQIDVNAADDLSGGNVYLTVTGTSAEAGDDGQVGRGNRVNGLITPGRPMVLEAAAGKNPVTHVGKIYNIVAGEIAEAIVREVPAVAAVECYLVSKIGQPVREPQIASLRVRCKPGETLLPLHPLLSSIVDDHLARTETLWQRLLNSDMAMA